VHVRRTISPAPGVHEGDQLVFNVPAATSPVPGSRLTMLIQT
jgi:hypothetical protein